MVSTHILTLLLLAAFAPFSQPKQLDVWVPPITDPTKDTIWHGGKHVTVRWDTSGAPKEITNPIGKLYLVSDGLIQLQNELAGNFPLTRGHVSIVVPKVSTGKYQVVLMGDSGNYSPNFTIVHP